MPIIEMHLMEGRTVEQKNKMAQAVTKAITETLEVPATSVRILITEHDNNGFYMAGISMAQRRSEEMK